MDGALLLNRAACSELLQNGAISKFGDLPSPLMDNSIMFCKQGKIAWFDVVDSFLNSAIVPRVRVSDF